jgi:hypothetical protein
MLNSLAFVAVAIPFTRTIPTLRELGYAWQTPSPTRAVLPLQDGAPGALRAVGGQLTEAESRGGG